MGLRGGVSRTVVEHNIGYFGLWLYGNVEKSLHDDELYSKRSFY